MLIYEISVVSFRRKNSFTLRGYFIKGCQSRVLNGIIFHSVFWPLHIVVIYQTRHAVIFNLDCVTSCSKQLLVSSFHVSRPSTVVLLDHKVKIDHFGITQVFVWNLFALDSAKKGVVCVELGLCLVGHDVSASGLVLRFKLGSGLIDGISKLSTRSALNVELCV